MNQQTLPLAEAEGIYAERLELLGQALCTAKCDKLLSSFVRWVFEVTAGGTHGNLKKSFEQLAARPWGLCCSKRTACRVVDRAWELGLVRVSEDRLASGSQASNEYSINWEGIRRLMEAKRPARRRVGTGCQFVTTHSQIDTTQCQDGNHIRGITTSSGHSLIPDPDPETVSETEPRSARTVSEEMPDVPALNEARLRTVAPLEPPAKLRYAVYEQLTEQKLANPAVMVSWFRMQLRAVYPVTGNTEAHLLLVLAAARYALQIKKSDVKKTRTALFIFTVQRRKWRDVIRYLPEVFELFEDPQFRAIVAGETSPSEAANA